MARKLVVCCDGTWNTPRAETNVFRTYRFLRERLGNPGEPGLRGGTVTCSGHARDGSEVMLFYDPGVGTNWFDRLAGGGLGAGLSDNVRDAYHFLAQRFTAGAEIYVFGFSRGAYTARSLCGFIRAAGLLKEPVGEKEVWRAYMDYYVTEPAVVARPGGWSLGQVRSWLRREAGDVVGQLGGPALDKLPRHDGVKVRFLGVYDTVGALGVPLPDAARLNEPIVGFHDTALSGLVEHAVHALAVDERRGPYTPTLWTQVAAGAALTEQTVLQVWFPGVHSDIGGGYRDKGIGDITWDFMMRQAARRGLVIDPVEAVPRLTLSPLPCQHESFDDRWRKLSGLKVVPVGIRSIGPTVRGRDGEALVAAGQVCLHPSLVDRIGKHVVTILDEDAGHRQESDYVPVNVAADTLPLFAATG
jgi:uncharacterized protein (DUF2235 family)